jgi:hypothetical protein
VGDWIAGVVVVAEDGDCGEKEGRDDNAVATKGHEETSGLHGYSLYIPLLLLLGSYRIS